MKEMALKTRGKHKPRRPGILIAGLGNILLKDDGVGVHAVRQLRQTPFSKVMAVEVGTTVLDALHLLEQADRILVIDALQAGGTAGTIYSFGLDEIEEGSHPVSLHEVSFHSALRFFSKPLKSVIRIIGVEPGLIEYGLDLSPAVQNALPRLLEEVEKIVGQWQLLSEKNEALLEESPKTS